ncbi:MAG: methylmalonyl-CoA epimerase [Acidobacteriota bacterium]
MKIDHIGIATNGIDEALGFWVEALGLITVHTENVEDQKVRVAMLPVGESRIELLEPLADDSPISKFLQKRGGSGGIHHIAFKVDDIVSALKTMKDRGMRLIDEEPRIGAEGCRVAFVHPASAGGILIELVEQKEPFQQ